MIPQSFQIMGHKIKVRITNDIFENNNGEWNPSTLEIRVKPIAKDFVKSLQEQIFWHEVTHCIFEMLSYEDHNKDEALVDRISQCLYQIDKTKK